MDQINSLGGLHLVYIAAVSLVLQMWMPQDLSRRHTKVQVRARQKNKTGKDPQQWDIWRKTDFGGGRWGFLAITLRS